MKNREQVVITREKMVCAKRWQCLLFIMVEKKVG